MEICKKMWYNLCIILYTEKIRYRETAMYKENGVRDEVIHDCLAKYHQAGIHFFRDGGNAGLSR